MKVSLGYLAMTDITKRLADALRFLVEAHDAPHSFFVADWNEAREAIAAYDAAPQGACYLPCMEEHGIGIYNVVTHKVEQRAAPLTAAMRTALRLGHKP